MACEPSVIYDKYIELNNASWNKFEEIGFDFPVKKQGSGYYIYLIVRFNENFPQMSLSFNAELDAPGGEQRFRDYDIMIKDPYKNLQGESHNEYYEIKIPLHENYKFQETGIARIEISNRMSKYETPGLAGFGLIVEKE